MTVQIGFPIAGTGAGGWFVLDSSRLDNTTQLLAPTNVMVDVSQYASQQLTVNRGRTRDVDQVQAGTCQFTLRNEDGRFDPSNPASPYYPGITPRAPLQLSVAGQPIFTGYVYDYSLQYTKPGTATVVVSGQDAFSLLATSKLHQYNAPVELSGSRVVHVLQRPEVNYQGAYNVDTGVNWLQDGSFDSGNFTNLQSTSVSALDHLQSVMWSEGPGALYVDRQGALQFRNQHWLETSVLANPQGAMTLTDTGGSYAGPGFGYSDVNLSSAATLLFNKVQGQRRGGATETLDDLTSQSLIGIRQLTVPTTENADDADVRSLVGTLLSRYHSPTLRFNSVSIELGGRTTMTNGQRAQLAMLDVGTVIVAERTPPGEGGRKITQLALVEHLTWTADASSGSCRLTVGLGWLAPYPQPQFILGTSRLDVGAISMV